MSTNTLPVIAGVQIACDDQGRYNINALHRASGGEARHQPSNWLQNQSTKEIVADIEEEEKRPAVTVTQGGAIQGTFVHKDLAYSYAMWVSPKFHRKVVQLFDSAAMGKYGALALTEAQKAKVAYWEDAKKRSGFCARDADWMIATIKQDYSALSLIEQQDKEEARWREETLAGQIQTQMEFMKGPGYIGVIRINLPFDVNEGKREILKYGKSNGLKLRVDEWRHREFEVESLY